MTQRSRTNQKIACWKIPRGAALQRRYRSGGWTGNSVNITVVSMVIDDTHRRRSTKEEMCCSKTNSRKIIIENKEHVWRLTGKRCRSTRKVWKLEGNLGFWLAAATCRQQKL